MRRGPCEWLADPFQKTAVLNRKGRLPSFEKIRPNILVPTSRYSSIIFDSIRTSKELLNAWSPPKPKPEPKPKPPQPRDGGYRNRFPTSEHWLECGIVLKTTFNVAMYTSREKESSLIGRRWLD